MKATNVRVKTSAGTVVSERRPILRAMFAPNSVALIGASEKPGSVGRALLENMQSFRGRVFPVNPNHATILGQKAFSKIRGRAGGRRSRCDRHACRDSSGDRRGMCGCGCERRSDHLGRIQGIGTGWC